MQEIYPQKKIIFPISTLLRIHHNRFLHFKFSPKSNSWISTNFIYLYVSHFKQQTSKSTLRELTPLLFYYNPPFDHFPSTYNQWTFISSSSQRLFFIPQKRKKRKSKEQLTFNVFSLPSLWMPKAKQIAATDVHDYTP